MSNATNTTINPTDACTSGNYQDSWVPAAWTDRTSSNFSQAACAVPACNSFPSTLAECCGRPESDLQYLNTSGRPFALCALANNNDANDYQLFQRCLAAKEVVNFKCNDPENVVAPSCGLGVHTSPNETTDWPNQQTCSHLITVSATRAMEKCCSNYNGGDGLVVYSNGCDYACTSDSTNNTFFACLRRNYNWGTQFGCTPNDGTEDPNKDDGTVGSDTGVGAQTLPSLTSIFIILLLGTSMLMI
ncbi:unnamed protein product [Aureobasidium mustum]|uniref:Uncharacterized protein n=1 Tax=Aureobasidium mustum TaxID=2773714 RepID=A0A9N8KBB9_9PEZI|nr:unnamed protein product [Aureobasidium mustum]